MDIQFYTVEQAAEILKAKKNTVRTYCREGKMPAIKVGRGYRIAKADLEKWLDEQKKGQVSSKEEERKLIEAEAKYRSLFENASDAIALFDIAGRLLVANQRFYDLSGYAAREAEGMHFAHFFYPEDLPVITERFMQRMVSDEIKSAFDARCVRKDGQTIQVEINSGRFTKEGKPSGVQIILRDVGERRKIEKILKESEERYRTLVQNAPGITFVGGLDYSAILMHGAVQEISGYTESDFLSGKQRWDMIVHPEDIAKLRASTKKLRTVPNNSAEHEYRIVRKDGGVRWVRAVVRNVCDDLGKPARVQGVVYDITERKKAELALKESEARYRGVIEDQTELVCRWLPGGTLTFANQSYCRYFGKKPEELIGHSFMPLIPDEDHEKVKKHFASLSAKNPVATHEHRVIRPNGEIRWMQWTNRVILDEKGLIKEFQDVGRDITERKKAEQELHESREMYKMLVKASPDSVTVTDLEGNITYVSERTLQLYGFKSAEELLGRSALECIAPEDREQAVANMQKTLKEGFVENAQYNMLRANGTRFIGELNTVLIKNVKGRPKAFIATVRDITERKKVEEERGRLLEAIEASSESIAVLDRNQQFIYVNQAFSQIHGYDPEEIKGKTWEILIPKENLSKVNEEVWRGLSSEGKWKGPCEVLRKDGTRIWVGQAITVLKDAKGQPNGFINVLRSYIE